MDSAAPVTVPPPGKTKRRVKTRTSSAHNPFAPTKQGRVTGIEIGLFISLGIVVLYMYGFFESVRSLPQAAVGLDGIHHIGGNLNLAKEEYLEGDGATDVSAEAAPVRHVNQAVPTSNSNIVIPETKWPVSITNENDFETIMHPGDGKTTMSVPRFWSRPVHNGGRLSRETAMQIGSCSEPDARGNRVRGDSCPVDQRTIFLAIASYRDFQCRFTIESAFLRAKNPDRIRVGELSARSYS